jgi:hypothetical protein
MSLNDCSTNFLIFEECIRQFKKIVTISDSFLEFAEAFDKVPHEAVLRASSSQGINVHTIALIEEMYTDICTQIN